MTEFSAVIPGLRHQSVAAGRAVVVGLGGAGLTVLLLLISSRIISWLIWRSHFTDLPGQDTLGLVLSLQPVGLGVIALIAGRVCGLLCSGFRWLAVLVSVLPLLLLILVSPGQFWYWYVLGPFLEMMGAYPPAWPFRRQAAGA